MTDAVTPVELPADLTRFVGRHDELAEVASLMRLSRLVTLTGVSGIGKTRLALQAARQATARHRSALDRGEQSTAAGGAVFVDLGDLPSDSDADDVRAHIAQNVGIRLSNLSEEAFLDALREREVLLVLDNCETVHAVVRACVPIMLAAAKDLHIIATSLAPLAVEGEAVMPVGTLAMPEGGSPKEILGSEAAQLLIERARIAARYDVIADTEPVVAAKLVALLGGNPLSIMLAAAQLGSLSVQQLIERLNADPLPVLADPRDRGRRHASQAKVLQATYEACSAGERAFWQAAAVFPGWFDLDTAVAVCTQGAVDERHILELVTGLTDRAVLEVSKIHGRAWYRPQRGAVRSFGLALLQASPRAEQVRRAHREHTAARVARAARSWMCDREVDVMAEVHDARADILTALDSMKADGDLRSARQLCAAWIATRAPFYFGYPDWARTALDRVLPVDDATSEDVTPAEAAELVTVYAAAVWVALNQGRREAADRHLGWCLAMLERAEPWLADADPAPAAAVRGAALFSRGNHVLLVAGHRDAVELLNQARILLHQAGPDHVTTAFMATLLWAMSTGLVGDDPAAAREAALVCLSEARAANAPWAISWGQWTKALAYMLSGDLTAAREQVTAGLRMQRDLRDRWGRTWSQELCGWILAASMDTGQQRLHDGDAAAWLLGSSARVQREIGVSLPGLTSFARFHDRAMKQVTEVIGEPWATRAFTAGTKATVERAMQCALGEWHPELSVAIPDTAAARRLTPREHEVAPMLLLGYTDHQIARILHLSDRTVENHVRHILRKLGITSRTQVQELLHE